MKNLFRMTLGRKITGLVALLLILSIASVVAIATQLFVRDNIALIQQMNLDTAMSRARAARDAFENTNQKMRFLGGVLAQSAISADLKQSMSKVFFEDNSAFQAVYLFRHSAGDGFSLEQKALSPKFEESGQENEAARLIATAAKNNLSPLLAGEPQVSLLVAESPWVALGVPFIKVGDRVTHSLFALLNPDQLLAQFADRDLTTTYLVDGRGKVIAHPERSFIVQQESFAEVPIVRDLLSGKFNNGQSRYLDPFRSEWMLGGFRLVGFAGLGVVAEVPEAKAFEAAERMKYRATLLGLGILFLALLGGYLFSGTLVRPILELVSAAFRVSKGDFSINLVPRGRDEIAYLSRAFSEMASGLQERDRVKELFGKFHNKEVADRLLSGEVKLGGERCQATILFMDIRSFTTMSEVMQPEEVVEMLNEYLTRMVRIITEHGGVIDKYVGDAIMGLWGVPLAKAGEEIAAVNACLAMRKELESLNHLRLERGQSPLYIGMGLHQGPVTAGNIGSSERMEYTVIGDAVNLAARVESMTKTLSTDLLITRAVHDAVKGRFIFEPCEKVTVKGKSETIEVYKVCGTLDEKGVPTLVETPYCRSLPEEHPKVA